MSIGSLDHVAQAVSHLTGLTYQPGLSLNLRKLTGSDNIDRLVFVMVTKDRNEGHYSYLIDQARLTTFIGVERHRTGCFVFTKRLYDALEGKYYKYWFAEVNGALQRVHVVTVHQLFKALNIKLTKSNDRFLSRDIEYPDLEVKQEYIPGRPGKKKIVEEIKDMNKAVIAIIQVKGRTTNVTIGDAIKHLGPKTTLGDLELIVKFRMQDKKEWDSIQEFFDLESSIKKKEKPPSTCQLQPND